jgi:hypothetical protein
LNYGNRTKGQSAQTGKEKTTQEQRYQETRAKAIAGIKGI